MLIGDGSVTKRKFNLEKVGQYLEDKPLQQVIKTDMHHLWQKLLDENECLRNSSLLYPHEKSLSLTQQRDKLFTAVDKVFQKPNESISAGFELDASFLCCSFNDCVDDKSEFIKTSYFVCEGKKLDLIAITTSYQDCFVLVFDSKFTQMQTFRLQTRPGPFTKELSNDLEYLRFVDLQFYNEDVISLLLSNDSEEKPQSFFLQFPLDQTANKNSHHTLPQNLNISDVSTANSIFDIIDSSCFKAMDNICTHLSVSGCRKVTTFDSYFEKACKQ